MNSDAYFGVVIEICGCFRLVVKFLWNFEPETSNFGRCYLSNLLDVADMV